MLISELTVTSGQVSSPQLLSPSLFHAKTKEKKMQIITSKYNQYFHLWRKWVEKNNAIAIKTGS